jgi:hypothetical protein
MSRLRLTTDFDVLAANISLDDLGLLDYLLADTDRFLDHRSLLDHHSFLYHGDSYLVFPNLRPGNLPLRRRDGLLLDWDAFQGYLHTLLGSHDAFPVGPPADPGQILGYELR